MVPLVYTIVLNWNGRRHLGDCLGSLSSAAYPRQRVVLVDNASQDDSVALVRAQFPQVHIIENASNIGFAEGNNVGIRYALDQGADYIVLLNNDTRVEPDFLTHLIRRGEEKADAGVLGGTVLMFYNPAIVNSTAVNLNRCAYGWDRDFGENAAEVHREAGEVLAVTGCLMAVKRQVFEAVGLLDPVFFAYFEDVDFCLRVWERTGFTVEYVPEAVVYHKFSASTSRDPFLKRKLITTNQYRILFRHFPVPEILRVFPLFTLQRLVLLAHPIMHGDLRTVLLELRLILQHWLFLPLFLVGRFFGPGRSVDTSRFRHMIVPEAGFPVFRQYRPGYERIALSKREVDCSILNEKVVMGVNDDILGPGWSGLTAGAPRMRTIQERALCYLKAGRGRTFLQVHGYSENIPGPCFLEVSVEGRTIGRRPLAQGWRTYLFTVEGGVEAECAEVRLALVPVRQSPGDRGAFGVNEVGLFSQGSPLLRWVDAG